MISVIGAGLPRTGTTSLKAALERLGFGPCHHMQEIGAHPEQAQLWRRTLDGPVDWNGVLRGYRAAVDWFLQLAYIARKGMDPQLRASGIEAFRQDIAERGGRRMGPPKPVLELVRRIPMMTRTHDTSSVRLN